MQHKILFLCLTLLSVSSINAQKHGYNWIQGYNSSNDPRFGGLRIDFNTEPPQLRKFETSMNFSLTCVTSSDSSGHLLFYSNGIRIFNKQHGLMENGDTINPGSSWETFRNDGYALAYGAISIPAPGKSNCYYIIHVGFQFGPQLAAISPMYSTLIDMNANGGLGKVLEKNVVISTESLVLPVAVKHGNGRDWWIITGKATTTTQYVYLVSPAGIEGPLVQDFGLVSSFPEGGICTISPDGHTYIRSQLDDGVRIYDFNRCEGTLGNQRFIPKSFTTDLNGGFFSADSRMAYFFTSRSLYQVDMQMLDTEAYIDTVVGTDYYADPAPPFLALIGFPQVGPDDKIYLNNLNTTFNLHVIHHPELPGASSDIQLHGLHLPRVNGRTTFNLPYYKLGEWQGSPCDSLGFQQPNDGFVRTWYEPECWAPARQAGVKVVPLFPPGPPIDRDMWEHDPLLPTNACRAALEKAQASKAKEELLQPGKDGH